MHILTVAYGHPSDPGAFDDYYERTHRPLAEKVPGLVAFAARHCAPAGDAEPPYYLIAELSFPSAESFTEALGSPQGQAAAADIENFADGGVTLFVQYD
ncbi:EthD family reductase [Amycolatopsis alkalitolerans]|uniref:EthD family reductase n=1 Tax=Amycolatopsis alkalitolerans TaxID=2547244 RepID=A0A5C4LZ96_9PSEU|nr:EthD family reductase [Amycolatopsis alkalitolerans]TNC25166.1 EthD family reductase [Amycolatopsis alkalitolerans]